MRLVGRLKGLVMVLLAILAVVLALVGGYYLAEYLVPKPKIGLIEFSKVIGEESAADLLKMLQYVHHRPDIKAAVLLIESPGGEASASEELYMYTLQLRQTKPVVASINQIGASGAYYLAVAANHIYAKPASFVGSIGVLSDAPDPPELDEDTISTGPFKGTGSPREVYARQMELLKDGFASQVLSQRGERLKVGQEVLTTGEVFVGLESLRMGLIDDIGSQAQAIQKAAQLAGLRRYSLVDVNRTLKIKATGGQGVEEFLRRPGQRPVPTFYYLYVGPRVR